MARAQARPRKHRCSVSLRARAAKGREIMQSAVHCRGRGSLGIDGPAMPLRYTTTAKVLHWLIGLALIGQIGFGWYLGEIERGTAARSVIVNLHKSIGLTLGVLILLRLLWRLRHPPPPFPDRLPPWQRVMARTSHIALYVCMVLMPLSGYIASNFSRWGVKYFGIALSPWGPDSPTIYAFFNGTHRLTSYVLVALICLHVIAAMGHLVAGDGVFKRMWLDGREG